MGRKPRRCCCGKNPPCSECDTNKTPTTITVNIGGTLDDLCSDCTQLDGNYTLDYGWGIVGSVSGLLRPANCSWGACFDITGDGVDVRTSTFTCVDATHVCIAVDWNGSDLRGVLEIQRRTPTLIRTTHVWDYTSPSTDCCAWTGLAFSYVSSSRADCDFSTGNFTVSSGVTCV